MNRLITFTTALFLLTSFNLFTQDIPENLLISKTDTLLENFAALQRKVADIHPCLNEHQPIAIAYKDSLLIFDLVSQGTYGLVKKTAQPFPLPKGIEASFPLSVYDNRATCVITPTTLVKPSGFATILHEFIHCCQFNSIEMQLKEELEIYKVAIEKQDYSWEITHPFPYDDSVFINYYDEYKQALKTSDIKSAKQLRAEIKDYLEPNDYEYMLWEEWKEGLARYVENKIRQRMGLELNNYGNEEPYDRVAFYFSGELLIIQLAKTDLQLPNDMGGLYAEMKKF